MTLVYELDDAVGQIASLLAGDVNVDTNLTGWADEAWRVKHIYTDDLILHKEHPVIYVSGTSTERRLIAADSEYETKMLCEIIVETGWSEPSDTTNAKRELMKLARRVEEVLRRNRICEPYWYKSVFHETKDPLKIEIYRLSVEQETMIGAVLMWFGYRRVQLST